MARKFTLKSRTATNGIDFSVDLNEEQLAEFKIPEKYKPYMKIGTGS